jgi:electron transfer flavoprotein beta subunit
MHIIVLVKQVPDTTEVKLDPRTGSLIREGIESIMNPDDRHALEAALRASEESGGKVTAVSMGPPQAVDAISEAIGMGVDQGILLSDTAFAGADTWATSFALGRAVEKIGAFDLIICGRQAIDGDTGQIGPQVAEYLGLPQITSVYHIEKIDGKSMVVRRRIEGGFERVGCPLPALITVTEEMNEPRYPMVGGLIDACGQGAPIEIWNAADIGVQTNQVGLEGSLTHVVKTFPPKFKREGEILRGDAKEAVAALMGKLRQRKMI